MPRTATPPQPVDARPRRPAWARAAASLAGTVRDARGTRDDPSGLTLEVGPDGRPRFAPAPARRDPARVAAARWSWRNRRTLAPLPVAAGYAALNAAPIADARTLVVAILTAPLAAAAAWLSILGGSDRTRPTLAILTITVTALQVWWLLPDAIAPPGAPLAVAALAVLASAYRFRIRPQETPMTQAPAAPWQVERWDELVGNYPAPGEPGGVLPGSRAHLIGEIFPPADDGAEVIEGEVLADTLEPTAPPAPIGFRLAVELVPGRQEISTLRGKLGLIAGVYSAARAGTVLDEVGNETRAIVTFTTRRFLAEVKVWRRPTLDLATGRFIWQTLADGSHGYAQVWIPGQGIRHFWLVGAMGGGKSGAVDCFLANVLSAGIAVADLVDHKGGSSIPHWQDKAIRFGTKHADGIAALRRGVLMVDYRYWLMARMPAVKRDGTPVVRPDGQPALGRTWVDPSLEWPIYVVLIEEWTQLVAPGNPLAPLAIALAAKIAALGRAGLVLFAPTTQPANLDLAFGGNRDLRTNIQAGNVLVLWTDQGSGNLATATRTIDLSRIPQGQPGVGYLVGPAQPRDLRGRVPFVEEPWDAVDAAHPGALGPRELALLDAMDAVSAGTAPDDAIAAALAGRPDDPDWPEIIEHVFAPLVRTGKANVTTAPAGGADLVWSGPPVLGDPALPPDPTTPQQALILDAIRATGEATAAQLRAALGGVTDQGMRDHLKPLLTDGRVERHGRGRYRLTPPGDPS